MPHSHPGEDSADAPAGTVTLLLTEIDGSTRLREQHGEAMRAALACHDALIEGLVTDYGGSWYVPEARGTAASLLARGPAPQLPPLPPSRLPYIGRPGY
jgi:class 3 adenylate cyclase